MGPSSESRVAAHAPPRVGEARLGTVRLDACEAIEISAPGAIQPHGMLLAVDPRSRLIRHCSANAEAIVGLAASALLGRPLGDLLDGTQIARLDDRLAHAPHQRGPLPVLHERVGAGPAPVHLAVHTTDDDLVLELEPERAAPCHAASGDAFELLRAALDRLDGTSLDGYASCLAEVVTELTGFPRVVVFEFLPDGTGAVVAERRPDAWPAFLGKRFPASDVPEQARRLFAINGLRFTPDLAYEPVPLLSDPTLTAPGRPIDLSHAMLRHAASSCTTYKRNMGHRSSFAVAIPSGPETLRGLVSCFDDEVRHVPPGLRSACEILGKVAATQLRDREAERRSRARLVGARRVGSLTGELARTRALACLPDHVDALAALVTADGFVLAVGETELTDGAVPRADDRAVLGTWLATRPERLVTTDELGAVLHAPAVSATCPPGLLAVRLHLGEAVATLQWYRSPLVQTVDWAGDPRLPATSAGPDDPVTPRGSFRKWQQTVRDRARPWEPDAVECAVALLEAVAEITPAADDAGQDIERFIGMASHDLKAPLRSINYATGFFLEDHGDALDADARERIEHVQTLATRAGALVDSLVAFARGHEDLRVEAVDVPALFADAVGTLEPQLRESGTDVRVSCEVTSVVCNRMLVLDVLLNLIGNAIRHNDRAAGERHVQVGTVAGESATFFVHDNGGGIASADLEEVFLPFRRLAPAGGGAGAAGTGLGLALVRNMVHAHGGRVWAESGPDAGTTFRFTLGPAGRGS